MEHTTRYPRIRCDKKAVQALCNWKKIFEKVYKRKFTYEEILLRALECLPYGELVVAEEYRKEKLADWHRKELEQRNQIKQ